MKKLLIFQILFSLTCSFYISSFIGIPPCFLCWIQRLLLVSILISLLLEKFISFKLIYTLIMLGIICAFGHILIQTFNIETGVCSFTKNRCETTEIELFGFLTIPMLSFINFLIILFIFYYKDKK
ncbi:disulfide bond formation protein B [Staphylococcus hominis]|uniref:disulfide bond formation protein B n=1 Tax=Staphylococcus hominis TaxID=1290 RepID=UPI0008A5F6D2|nr:disulfide bond formation protein B [Staphylococcus hominis]OFM77879.1 hypothetical protein HMPREF2662_08620 [Staphylococcus sp. HMSC074B09]PAL08460.1 hypothetical protein B8W90_09510 [Staphylococcus hominis]